MRVLVLTNLYPNPLQPNRATYNRQQLRALAAEHEVRVIAPVAWTDEWRSRSRRSGTTAMDTGRWRTCDGMVVHHPRYVFTPKVLRSQYGTFLARSVRGCFDRAIDELRPDVVLGCWAYPDGWAAVRLARAAGLPVAIKVHGSDVLCMDDHAGRRRRTVEALAGADHVIAVSRDLAERVARLGVDPGRLSVVYNGVDTDLFRPGPKDQARRQVGYTLGDPLVVFAGNLVPVKGLDVLLDALAELAARGRPFHCVLIGDGPLRDALGHRAARLGLAGRVQVTGSRPLDELPSWYRAADLFVLPSRSEGVPNVLLEAASCGTPFLASRVGGIPEIAPPDVLFEPANAGALADRIERSLAERAAGMASPFRGRSWTASARDLAAVLGGIVGRARSSSQSP